MKIILSGYPRTKEIIPAVTYLLNKYLPNGFEITFLNNEIGVQGWSTFMRGELSRLSDRLVIVADGDFLINKPMDTRVYELLLSKVKGDVVCARLCYSSFYTPDQYTLDGEVMTLVNAPYSAVLQYCIWDREFLIDLLSHTTDPWNFESYGSEVLNKSGKKVIATKEGALSYFELGALSHEKHLDKIRVTGVGEDDIEHLVTNGYLTRDNLI